MKEQQLEIVFNRQINSNAWLMGLNAPEMAKSARPGQFVMIRVSRSMHPLLRRPFSICGTKDTLMLILYRVVGQGTAIMAHASHGQKFSVLGPLGRGFTFPDAEGSIVLVGGGIGVAPLFFLAQNLKKHRFLFMAGFGSADEIIPVGEVIGTQIDVSIATDDGSIGHKGPVTELLEKYIAGRDINKKAISLFTCGPKPMLKRIADMSRDQRFWCEVSLEASMACGVGACQGCAVKAASGKDKAYYHVCKDGPVFAITSIDWASY